MVRKSGVSRAAVACKACRRRKGKCHYQQDGSPCAYCKQAGIECWIIPPKRQGKQQGITKSCQPVGSSQDNWASVDSDAVYPSVDVNIEFITQFVNIDEQEFLGRLNTPFTGYNFLKLPGLDGLQQDRIENLASCGCLSVPPRHLLADFIYCYFLFIHCNVPIINEATFWSQYLTRRPLAQPDSDISLFVLQALLFLSSNHVPMDTIQKLGYSNRETAREAFYERAKMLYEFQAEINPLYVAQGCLLLSHQATRDNPDQAIQWLAIAIHNATMIGAHKPLKGLDLDDNKKKRLWWSILIRDRAISLGSRRSILVRPPLLDIATKLPCELDFEDEIHQSRVYQPSDKRKFIKMFRSQLKLSVELTEFLAVVTTSPDSFNTLDLSPMDSSVLVAARGKLCEWLEDPDGFRLLEDIIDDPLRQPTNLYRSLILLQFHAATHMICTQEVEITASKQIVSFEDQSQLINIFKSLQVAESSVTEVIKGIVQFGQVQHVPLTIATYIALPFLLNAVNFLLARVNDRHKVYKDGLQYYILLMRGLQSSHQGACYLAELIQELVRAIEDVLIPLQYSSISTLSDPAENWMVLFASQPWVFLRICYTLNLAITHGKIPERFSIFAKFDDGNRELNMALLDSELSELLGGLGGILS